MALFFGIEDDLGDEVPSENNLSSLPVLVFLFLNLGLSALKVFRLRFILIPILILRGSYSSAQLNK